MLCRICNFEIFNDENILMHYIASYPNSHDSNLHYKYIVKKINLNDINKIFDYYTSIQNKKFNFYSIKCLFQLQFNNNIIAKIEINNHYNNDYIKIENHLSLYLNSCQNAGYNFSNINHMINNFITCKCNIKYKHYVDKPMSMLERRINYIIAKNPCLIKKQIIL